MFAVAEVLNFLHVQATVEWFKIYKMPDGKPANEFAFNGEPKNKEFAEKVIAGTHESWKKLMAGTTESGGISLANTSLNNTNSMEAEGAVATVTEMAEQGEDMPLPEDINKWHYVSLK